VTGEVVLRLGCVVRGSLCRFVLRWYKWLPEGLKALELASWGMLALTKIFSSVVSEIGLEVRPGIAVSSAIRSGAIGLRSRNVARAGEALAENYRDWGLMCLVVYLGSDQVNAKGADSASDAGRR
jgi:hypothetical protein